MTPFEDSDPQAENHPDEFLNDEGVREIQSQLESDAQHLFSLYPPMDANRLDQLVNRCLVTAETAKEDSDKPVSTASSQDAQKSLSHATRWYQVGTAICIGIMLVGSFVYLWNQPGLESHDQPIVSNQSEAELELVPAVSVSTLPTELLNASQPQLEALYDEMPSESMSIEF